MSIKILVCDPIDPEGIEKLREAGFKVDLAYSITKKDLEKKVREYNVLIVRSRTKVTREIIEYGKRLSLIARAGAGLDNIDLKAAEEMGIAVINTPEASADSFGTQSHFCRFIDEAREMAQERVDGHLVEGQKVGFDWIGKHWLKSREDRESDGNEDSCNEANPAFS